MENGVPLVAGGISSLYYAVDFHGISAIGERFYADRRETKLEPGYLIWWSLNNLTLGRGLEVIMEGISDVQNVDGEVVSGSDGSNNKECQTCK